ncbi:3',5'-cyclic-nucleotide phosphodiesterase pde1 [Microbotryomycetes sp. JL201]|nr:3',5'-cyclic-nucleotide phosphodiesterase pde1 [Microbotryomycetes sp. JL201]
MRSRGDKTLPVPPLPPRTTPIETRASTPPVTVFEPPDELLSAKDAERQARQWWEDNCAVVRLDGWRTRQHDPAFDLLVIGCGGGPLETNLSSYLVKPYSTKWTDGCTSLEGGSTMGAIATLVEQHPHSFAGFNLDIGVDFEEQHQLLATLPPPVPSKEPGRISRPKPRQRRKPVGVGREGGGRSAGRVSFAVTHAHLDHILGLVISSGASLEPRPLYGLPRTLDNIDRVFDGGVWPKLAGYESDGVTVGRAYLYRTIQDDADKRPMDLSPGLSFTARPVSHGMDPSMFFAAKRQAAQHANGSSQAETYDSTAFFVKESVTGHGYEFLFFGDVEPDSISKRPLTRHVWQEAAPKIVAQKLSTIFLECSYPTTQPTEKLWGHLSPPFMFEELGTLARLVVQERVARGWDRANAETLPLQGVTVVIIHIKDDTLPLASHDSHDTSDDPESSGASSRDVSPARPLSLLTLAPPEPTRPARRPSSAYTMSPFSWGAKRRWLESTPPVPAAEAPCRRASIPWNVGSGGYGFGVAGTLSPSYDELDQPSRHKSLPGHDDAGAARAGGGGGSAARSGDAGDDAREVSGGPFGGNAEDVVMEEETVHERIERELHELEHEKKLGVNFLRAEQGMRIVF